MATPDEQKAQQREQWSSAAPGWAKYDDWIQRQLDALSRRMLDAAGVTAATRLLDLACGSGEPALSAARRGARVLATDLSPEMVEVTRRRAAREGVALEVRVMDLEQMDVPDASFDVVTCRCGLMFCPQPELAATEIHRALAPGGRFAVAVWDEPAKNPFFTSMGQLVQQFVPAPPPDPKAPGMFRLAPPGELERVMRAGGFSDVTVESLPIAFECGSPEEYWEVQRELAAPLKGALAQLPAGETERLRAAVLDLAERHRDGGVVRFAAQSLIASGTR